MTILVLIPKRFVTLLLFFFFFLLCSFLSPELPLSLSLSLSLSLWVHIITHNSQFQKIKNWKIKKEEMSESTRLLERLGPPGWQRRSMMAFNSTSKALLLSIKAIVFDFTFNATTVMGVCFGHRLSRFINA